MLNLSGQIVVYVFLIALLAIVSCKSKEEIVEKINVTDQAQQLLDPPLTLVYNVDSTYVLAIGTGSSRSNPLSLSYCVFDKRGDLMTEKLSIHGKVDWHNADTLIIEEVPRVMNKREAAASKIKYHIIKEEGAK